MCAIEQRSRAVKALPFANADVSAATTGYFTSVERV
jgi:hypothetical protein